MYAVADKHEEEIDGIFHDAYTYDYLYDVPLTHRAE
jgi:hypothetical protein